MHIQQSFLNDYAKVFQSLDALAKAEDLAQYISTHRDELMQQLHQQAFCCSVVLILKTRNSLMKL